jgi:hypothetical protein
MSSVEELPRKRGRKQREEARQSEALPQRVASSHTNFDSKLARHLIEEWSWGHISAAEVQRLAHFAYDDEVELLGKLGHPSTSGSKSLRALAHLGHSGKWNQNIHRDLVLYLGEPASPPPLEVPIHVKSMKPGGSDEAVMLHNMQICLPHVEFAYMYAHRRELFCKYILGEVNNQSHICKFWQTVKSNNDPRLENHPLLKRQSHERLAVPISIHGDAVPCIAVGRAGFDRNNVSVYIPNIVNKLILNRKQ